MTSSRPESPATGTRPAGADGSGPPRQPAGAAPTGEQPRKVGRAVETSARAVGTGARATGRGVAGVARATGRAGRFTLRQARRATNAEGAGTSGLSRLIELHAFNAAGDAAVAISLAGTLFFQVPTGEARGQVALFLGLTMLPFAIVAPLIGPFLDRFSHGRRWAIGATMAVRAFLVWVLATAVVDESKWMFPAALGCLVASKAYGVTRAAAVPRVLPDNLTLVKANARLSIAGLVGAAVSAPLAGLAAYAGSEWALRYAFVLFVLATIWAIRLPPQVDSDVGEGQAVLTPGPASPGPGAAGRGCASRGPWRSRCAPTAGRGGCRASSPCSWRSCCARTRSVTGAPWCCSASSSARPASATPSASGLARSCKNLNPRVTVVIALLADAVMVLLAALFYGVLTLAMLGLVAGLAQSLAKLSLDSTIQRDVHERVRTSAFARSDTTLQLAWVIGGFVGIAMPLIPHLGLAVACAVLASWTVFVLGSGPVQRRRTTVPATVPADGG